MVFWPTWTGCKNTSHIPGVKELLGPSGGVGLVFAREKKEHLSKTPNCHLLELGMRTPH